MTSKRATNDRSLRWGDGFITPRGNRFQARWPEPQSDGSVKWRARTFPTDTAAEDYLRELGRSKRSGRYTSPSTVTVKDIVDMWLSWGESRWKSATLSTYRLRAHRYVITHLGSTRVIELTSPRVQRWVDDLRDAGLDASTIDCASRVLNGACKEAVRLGIVDRNPVSGVRKPAIRQKPIPTWTIDDVQRVIATIRDDAFWLALYQFALASGVRPGELRALRWRDIDLTNGIVTIRRTITRDANGLVVMGQTTKTGEPRSIAIPATCSTSLRRWATAQKERRLQAVTWHDDDLVFDRGDGQWLPLTTWQRQHNVIIANAGVRPITLHQLRHTSATLDMEAGISPKIISERLGHRRIETTLDLYMHVSVDLQRAAAEALADRLFGPADSATTSDG